MPQGKGKDRPPDGAMQRRRAFLEQRGLPIDEALDEEPTPEAGEPPQEEEEPDSGEEDPTSGTKGR